MNNTNNVKELIAEVLNEAAEVLSTGRSLTKVKVGVTILGSEHGISEVLSGAEIAQKNLPDTKIIVIGTSDIDTNLCRVPAPTEDACHEIMEKMLESGEIDAAVTMHYSFPIGTSTVGLVVTPGRGKKMFLSTTTGTSATDRVEGMVRNAVYGIAAAKAYGIANPTIGILNIDGSRQTERILNELSANGYNIHFADSQRADGGVVMRGNDLLGGVPDVMVTDSLTGNMLMKVFSAYTTGGSYESLGYGYGPGVGEGFSKIINIISRASGAPVIAGAIEYAAAMAKGNLPQVAAVEISSAQKAGLNELAKQKKSTLETPADIKMPAKKVVCQQISGVDVLELENAQKLLWQNDLYAETGMGCTGPIILVASEDYSSALKLLKDSQLI